MNQYLAQINTAKNNPAVVSCHRPAKPASTATVMFDKSKSQIFNRTNLTLEEKNERTKTDLYIDDQCESSYVFDSSCTAGTTLECFGLNSAIVNKQQPVSYLTQSMVIASDASVQQPIVATNLAVVDLIAKSRAMFAAAIAETQTTTQQHAVLIADAELAQELWMQEMKKYLAQINAEKNDPAVVSHNRPAQSTPTATVIFDKSKSQFFDRTHLTLEEKKEKAEKDVYINMSKRMNGDLIQDMSDTTYWNEGTLSKTGIDSYIEESEFLQLAECRSIIENIPILNRSSCENQEKEMDKHLARNSALNDPAVVLFHCPAQSTLVNNVISDKLNVQRLDCGNVAPEEKKKGIDIDPMHQQLPGKVAMILRYGNPYDPQQTYRVSSGKGKGISTTWMNAYVDVMLKRATIKHASWKYIDAGESACEKKKRLTLAIRKILNAYFAMTDDDRCEFMLDAWYESTHCKNKKPEKIANMKAKRLVPKPVLKNKVAVEDRRTDHQEGPPTSASEHAPDTNWIHVDRAKILAALEASSRQKKKAPRLQVLAPRITIA